MIIEKSTCLTGQHAADISSNEFMPNKF